LNFYERAEYNKKTAFILRMDKDLIKIELSVEEVLLNMAALF